MSAVREHFPDLYDYSIAQLKNDWVLVNRTRDGRLETFDKLVFHGGPGSTLEMRVFSERTLKQMLVDQICQASGGHCTYTGRDMKSAHTGMGINSADFDALLEDLAASLDKFKVGQREKSELMGALAPLKREIVEK